MTTPPIMSVTDELIAELEAAAKAATPQDFDSAASKYENGTCECHVCGGEGTVDIEADYLNYDDAAIGVQFYGIGQEFGAAESYYRRADPATIRALLSERAELKRDAERLDRLDREVEAYGFEGVHEGNRWMIDGPFRDIRTAIDAMTP